MKNINKYDIFFLCGIAVWLLETWYFGWNESAVTVPEKMFDTLSLILIAYGTIGGIGSSIKTDLHIHTGWATTQIAEEGSGCPKCGHYCTCSAKNMLRTYISLQKQMSGRHHRSFSTH
jgi:hypothetical protein